MKFSSPLPTGCRLTSGYGRRNGILHAGTDYAPPKPGETGIPVYAVADGTVQFIGYGSGLLSDYIPYHSGRFIYLDHGLIGGDRMRTYYGHLAQTHVTPGSRVRAGDQIGIMGGSGSSGEDHFPIHLHFGVSQNSVRPIKAATRYKAPGWINADVWLRSKGITVGKTAPLEPPMKLATAATVNHVRSTASIRNICIKAGHGDDGTSTGLLIERYQHRQHAPYQLVWDRVWGRVTEDHYQWCLDLQSAMNKWKGRTIPVDGDYGKVTVKRVFDLQTRNSGGTYQGVIDGVAGPVFCRMLGVSAR